jgi:hypothetical protein
MKERKARLSNDIIVSDVKGTYLLMYSTFIILTDREAQAPVRGAPPLLGSVR